MVILEDVPDKILVIIDAGRIQNTIRNVKSGFGVECIIVDVGSVDRTPALTEEMAQSLFRVFQGTLNK